MSAARWNVLPLAGLHRADLRAVAQPYYVGRSHSLDEYACACSVKRILTSRGVACFVELVEASV